MLGNRKAKRGRVRFLRSRRNATLCYAPRAHAAHHSEMITVDLLRGVPLFASLPASELETLAARGADIRLRAGDWLIHEGEVASFFMLLEGRIEVRKVIHGVDRLLITYAPGHYFGEVPLLLASPAVPPQPPLEP